MSRSRIDLYDLIISGKATDQDIEEYLGPQLVMELGAQWLGWEATLDTFRQWYRLVMEPIGIDEQLCFQLYTGKISSIEFEEQLHPTLKERFLRLFEPLQKEYLRRYNLDGGLS